MLENASLQLPRRRFGQRLLAGLLALFGIRLRHRQPKPSPLLSSRVSLREAEFYEVERHQP